jgi:hypothetical protein
MKRAISPHFLHHTLKYDQLKNVFIITRQGKTTDHLTSKDLIWAKKIMAEVEIPVVTKTGTGWNATGMHHLDLHKIGERLIAVVDGRS